MQLIKIFSDRVHIKTDSKQISQIKINDLMLLSDNKTSIVCIVTSISGNDSVDICDFSGSYLGETEPNNVIECGIVGSIKDGHFTKSVDVYPTTRVSITPIDKIMFEDMLSSKSSSSFKLGEYSNFGCNAYIDGNKFFQRHSAIVGNTGCGKSFTVTSILEKLATLKSSNVILFDLHGEYTGLSYAKNIKVGNGGYDFPVWFLPFRDMYTSLFKIKEETATNQIAELRKAYYTARRSLKREDIPLEFDIKEIESILTDENEKIIPTGEFYKTGDRAGEQKVVKGENNGKLNAIISLIRDKVSDKRYKFMFNQQKQSYFNEFANTVFGINDKHIKIIDLSDVPHDMVPIVVSVITKLIYTLQLQQDRTEILPLNIVCDEAHVYIPSDTFGIGASQRRILEIFEIIATEGRKFGITLTIVNQRPSELNRTIMAQCANFIVLKMSNEVDKQIIKNILPESNRGLIDMLSLFSPGDCFVVGDSADMTFKIKIDLPREAPLSNTLDTWDCWSEYKPLDVNNLVNKLMEDKQNG